MVFSGPLGGTRSSLADEAARAAAGRGPAIPIRQRKEDPLGMSVRAALVSLDLRSLLGLIPSSCPRTVVRNRGGVRQCLSRKSRGGMIRVRAGRERSTRSVVMGGVEAAESFNFAMCTYCAALASKN